MDFSMIWVRRRYIFLESFVEAGQFRIEMVVLGHYVESQGLQGRELLLLNHLKYKGALVHLAQQVIN